MPSFASLTVQEKRVILQILNSHKCTKNRVLLRDLTTHNSVFCGLMVHILCYFQDDDILRNS